jgi:predicted transposase YbfD/YdcC
VEKNRGRLETRTVTTTTNLIESGYLDWPGAKQLIRLERHTVHKGKVRKTTTYAITSLSRKQAHAAFLLKHLRGRWLIESRFHVLDTQLGEDHCRVRTGHAGHALSTIRHMALNLAQKLQASVNTICQEHAAKIPVLLHRLRIMKN